MPNNISQNNIDSMFLYVNQVKQSLKHSNRFSVDDEFNRLLIDCLKEKTTTIEKGQILYRARIYLESDQYEKYNNYEQFSKRKFAGYDKKDSFINLCDDWNHEGRMNPAGIKYLYTAYEIDTCLAEIKPYAKTLVSIAKIKVKEDLKTVDFGSYIVFGDTQRLADFSLAVNLELGRGNIENGDYVLSQYIAEFCKCRKFDAMTYHSSFKTGGNPGNNVTIFNYNKCEAISSKLYYINDVSVNAIKL